MSRRKNKTDQQFREQLRHFEAGPPDQVWHGIASALHSDKRKRQVLWVSRIAASIAVLLALGTTWFLLREPPENQLVTRETQEAGTRDETGTTMAVIPDTMAVIPDDKAVIPVTRAEIPEITGEMNDQTEGNLADADYADYAEVVPGDRPYMDQLNTVPPRSATGLQTDYPGTILAVLYPSTVPDENEGIDVFDEWGDDRITSHDKWGVGTQVSPIYSYRNLEVSDGSAPSASYYNDVEDGIVSYAGGVNVHYTLLKRLSVQSGLYYSSMGMKVGNAYYASLDSKNSFMDATSTIQASINNSTGIIETQVGLDNVYAANTVPQAGLELTSQYARANSSNAPEGEILQQFEYLEVPLILRYRVIDRRLGFHFLGGLSSNFLVGNSAYYLDGGNKEQIGTTGNLRPVNYSSVVGLGVDYSISRRFHVNLEPTFRYYLNSINTGSMIKSHPYTIGFYTGLLYTF
ncbi:MAG: outer membrane beta-barrel protein [Bacteroidales bacterium]